MKDLIEAKNTIGFLREHGIIAKKKYGQNFLIDRRVLDRIISGAGITKDDTVLEIGPGIGTLTQALCESAGRVIAVEIDSSIIPFLKENLEGYDNYEIVNEDILKTDIAGLIGKDETIKAAANLPYYITTPIIMELLEGEVPFTSITVMVQKEVADRMQAKPGSKDYGALTLAVKYYSDVSVIANVPQNSFVPRPNVDSAVVKLDILKKPRVEVSDKTGLFNVIRASFSQRRKTLANALKNDAKLHIPREKTEMCLGKMNFPPDVRGERLSLEEFAELYRLLTE